MQRALARSLLLNRGEIAMNAALFLVPYIALGFQHTQNREHGSVSELVRQTPAHIGYHGRTVIPEHLHHIRLAVGQHNGHGGTSTMTIVDGTSGAVRRQL